MARIAYSLLGLVFAATAGLVAADSNDWVNPNYVIQQANAGNTADARQNILSKAGGYAKSGPWSIVTKNSAKPPSGDMHDYLSWAPYHWPNCNWCSKGTSHLSGPGNDTDGDDGDDDNDNDNLYDDDPYYGDDPYEDGGSDEDDRYEALSAYIADVALLSRDDSHNYYARLGHGHRRMVRRRRQIVSHSAASAHSVPGRRQDDDTDIDTDTDIPLLSPSSYDPVDQTPTASVDPSVPTDDVPPEITNVTPPVPTTPPNVGQLPTTLTTSHSSTVRTISRTLAPAQAPAKTGKDPATKCTSSPAKSLAPSATWTTCPYVVRDGKVNPDVRTLPDSPAAVEMAQAVLYNAVAYALGMGKLYSQNAAKFIQTFFISPDTSMNPNMNYGQQVRGPGKAQQMGTFAGVIDLRGIVKVVNSILLLQVAKSPDWTSTQDDAMRDWMRSYSSWLQNSALGKETAKKANNHFTFYVSQLAVVKMYAGDTPGAQAVLKDYFDHQFADQVAKSGEQPFEAVRTRPYHYRCFNLEAMITNAKLGDQLGLNFWTAKSKYGATIQTALDYAMAQDPKSEDISDIFPHVAAVAAAYGDPKGKYAAFLKKYDTGYTGHPYWFYDQSEALPNSPAGHAKLKHRRQDLGPVNEEAAARNTTQDLMTDVATAEGMAIDAANDAENGEIPFQCPEVFLTAKETELDNGIFVTCEQLERFYEIPLPTVGPEVL